jgi:hypothetical protein
MKRNFGFPSETSRETVGGDQLLGPLHSAIQTRADTNIISLADYHSGQPNSERLTAAPFFIPADDPFELGQLPEPPFDYREFGACFLFGLAVLTPALFVTAAVVIYATLIA